MSGCIEVQATAAHAPMTAPDCSLGRRSTASKPPNSRSPSRWAAAVVLLAALLWAVTRGAGSLLYGPDALLSTPVLTQPSDLTALERRTDRLRLALRLDPLNPSYHAAIGRLYEQAAAGARGGLTARREHLQAALSHHQRAARLRPTWPYDRAAMVRTKLKLGIADQAVSRQLAEADRLGRWEAGLQRSLLETTLALWPHLTADDRTRLKPMLRAALALQPAWLIDAAQRHRRDPLLASLIDGDVKLEALAERLQRRRDAR